MLAQQRNIGESIIITTPDGYRVKVKISSFYKDGVRLEFETCPQVSIVRGELEDKQPTIIRKMLVKDRPLQANCK